jgi:hypothetical protein
MLRDSLNMLPLIYRLLQLDMFYLAIIFNLSRPDCHEIISVLNASAKRSSTRQIRTGSSHFPLAGKVDALVIAGVRPQLVKAIISIELTGPPVHWRGLLFGSNTPIWAHRHSIDIFASDNEFM